MEYILYVVIPLIILLTWFETVRVTGAEWTKNWGLGVLVSFVPGVNLMIFIVLVLVHCDALGLFKILVEES